MPVLVEDVLQELHPVSVGVGRVAGGGEAHGGDPRLAEHLAVLLVERVVQDHVDADTGQGLGVELAVVVVGGVHLKDLGSDLGGDGVL